MYMHACMHACVRALNGKKKNKEIKKRNLQQEAAPVDESCPPTLFVFLD